MSGGDFAAELAAGEPYDFGGDPDGVTLEAVVPVDWALDLLLSTVFGDDPDTAGNSFGITVTFAGSVVSGLAIHSAEWERLWTQEVESSAPAVGQALHFALTTTRALTSRVRSRREEENRPNTAVKHLHLAEAVVFTGGQPLRVGLWRGRLDMVAGWSPTRTTPA